MSFLTSARGLFLAAAVILPLAAYNPPTDTAGPLTVRIDGPGEMTRTGVPVPIKILLENSSGEVLRGSLRVSGIDRWSVIPAGPVSFDVPANGSREYAT